MRADADNPESAEKLDPAMPDDWQCLILIHDEKAMDAFGRRLAAALPRDAVVALIGTLGAGKTRLVRAVASAEGVPEQDVQSPTFVLCHEYFGRWPIYHLDAYRMQSVDEFLQLGVEEYWQAGGWTFVEWADRVAQALPADHLQIQIEIAGPESRRLELRATGPRHAGIIRAIAGAQ